MESTRESVWYGEIGARDERQKEKGRKGSESEVERTCLLASCLDTLFSWADITPARLNLDKWHSLFSTVILGLCLCFA